jgi:hypothetical protein
MEALDINSFNSKEEYIAELQKIYGHYANIAKETEDEMQGLFANNAEMNAEYGLNLTTAFGQTDLASIYGVGSFSELSGSIGGIVGEKIQDMGTAYQEKTDNLDEIKKIIGIETWDKYYANAFGEVDKGFDVQNGIFKAITEILDYFTGEGENSFLNQLITGIREADKTADEDLKTTKKGSKIVDQNTDGLGGSSG